MPDKFTELTPELHHYSVEHSSFRDDGVKALEAQADAMGDKALMQIAGDQAAFITILVRAMGAVRCLEVGTFLGYGAVAIARGLPIDGTLVCCEISSEYAARAEENLKAAQLYEKVAIRVGPAAETLAGIDDENAFDFAFIDADKDSYPEYYEQCLRLIRSGGVIMFDNVYMGGRILERPDESSKIVDELNSSLASDDRVDVAVLGIADGVTLALKK